MSYIAHSILYRYEKTFKSTCSASLISAPHFPVTTQFLTVTGLLGLSDDGNVSVLGDSDDELFQMSGAQGNCKVMCFHPRSDLTLALMSLSEIRTVIDKWADLQEELSRKYTWVQVCKYRSSIMWFSVLFSNKNFWGLLRYDKIILQAA